MTSVNDHDNDEPPRPPLRSAATPCAQHLPASAAARSRLPPHVPSEGSPSPRPPPVSHRRTSMLSFSSLEDASRLLAEELIDPRTAAGNGRDETALTNWHSSPLAFAILPAVAGLLFKNGSAFVTDVMLLGLAAVFMNWSIRLPWHWYYSAQTLRNHVEPDYDPALDQDGSALETASSAGSSPKASPDPEAERVEPEAPGPDVRKRELAAAELRRQELFALGATFFIPLVAAYLLHVIRAQLSGTPGGLVSDYNISIFLLAAEIRPIRQVVRLMSANTLHLQRTVHASDERFLSAIYDKTTLDDFQQRIIDLEAKVSETANRPPTATVAQKSDMVDLSAEIKKRYEPRLDGIERAVRRYEKRSITLATVTEQRLQGLETRIQEALSLAASAAHESQSRGALSRFLDTVFAMVSFPVTCAWNLLVYPAVMLERLYDKVRSVLLGPMPPRTSKNCRGRRGSANGEDGRARKDGPLRRISK